MFSCIINCIIFFRFGELNIPSVIEAALRRLQERARLQGNVRDNNVLPRHDLRTAPSPSVPSTQDRSPFSGGVIDLSRLSLNEGNNRKDITSSGNSATNSNSNNPRWDIGTLLSSSTLGRNGVSPLSGTRDNKFNRNSNTIGSTQNGNGPFVKNNDLLQMPTDSRSFPSPPGGRTGSNLRTFQDKTFDKTAMQSNTEQPTLDMQAVMTDPWTSQNSLMSAQNPTDSLGKSSSFDATGSKGFSNNIDLSSSQFPGQFPPRNFDVPIPAPSRINDFQSIPKPPSLNMTQQPNSSPQNASAPAASAAPVAGLSLNATAKVSASSAEANSTTNQTSTKSVKTKTIKVTTVVKSSPKADVAAAAASQATNIANAVASGKQISNPELAQIASNVAGSGVKKANRKSPAAGSITVRRQPNGDSIITLADGLGEPVVLRASGPVRIERIVKANGRIQFLINPVLPKQTTVDPTVAPADGEIEPEDITTTQTPTQASVGFTDAIWTTNAPFYSDPILPASGINKAVMSKSAKTPVPAGTTKIEKTIQIKETAVADTASASVNTSVKNETASASVQTNGLMQLFKPPNIPRPPKVPDTNVGNVGLINQFIPNNQKYMNNQQTKTIPLHSDISLTNKHWPSTTHRPVLPNDRHLQSLNIFQTSANQSPQQNLNTDVMPQYNLLGVSQPSLTFVPQGKPIP